MKKLKVKKNYSKTQFVDNMLKASNKPQITITHGSEDGRKSQTLGPPKIQKFIMKTNPSNKSLNQKRLLTLAENLPSRQSSTNIIPSNFDERQKIKLK